MRTVMGAYSAVGPQKNAPPGWRSHLDDKDDEAVRQKVTAQKTPFPIPTRKAFTTGQSAPNLQSEDYVVKEMISKHVGSGPLATEEWLAYLHQTGKRDDSPFLSCTALMPGMVRSHSKVLRDDVIPKADKLGTYLVPRSNFKIAWPDPARVAEYGVHTLTEREVLYLFPPHMETFELMQLPNPWLNTPKLIPRSNFVVKEAGMFWLKDYTLQKPKISKSS
jgi:hypothetical protein